MATAKYVDQKTGAIVTVSQAELIRMQDVGQTANESAKRHVFEDYTSRKAANTLKAHRVDLATFADYLTMVEIRRDAQALRATPEAWQGMTWGLVEGFVKWMLREGYSVASVNRKLSTVKTYCKLATKAEQIDALEYAQIRMVSGYSDKEGKRVDEKRGTNRHIRDGRPAKKADHVSISAEDANGLKYQPQTPQGRRDAVIMALLLDLGLRVGELAALTIDNVDLKDGTIAFLRPKVDMVQTHRLSKDAKRALSEWFTSGDAPAIGPLLRGSRKGGHLTESGMSERAITARVGTLGAEIGIDGLSAHDCRHYWATRAATMGTDAFALRDAGGWKSMAMPSRYVEAATISNDRVRL